jgi:dipeptidyl-peptidase-3
MKRLAVITISLLTTILTACGEDSLPPEQQTPGVTAETAVADDWQPADVPAQQQVIDDTGFVWQTEQFADIRIMRYQVPGWDKLDLRQKLLAYYLNQAGLAGRDIMWDQNYRHNLALRKLLESIYNGYAGNRNTLGWQRFETYLKRVWFANGIHHHYSMAKFKPEFSPAYLLELAKTSGTTISPELQEVIFDPALDGKKVELDADKGLLEHSAVNFYAPDLGTAEVQAYYRAKSDPTDTTPVSYGLNSRLVRNQAGQLEEQVWKLGGLYSDAIAEIISWLELAVQVAENAAQVAALEKLIEYYRTGDLKIWDEYNMLWIGATGGDIDYINGFIEVYNDPLGYRGSYESIVQIKDVESSARMQVLMDNAVWFERNSPVLPQHKREQVVGITYNVVNTTGESGDASPSTPVGVNLPNANWIRSRYGSKSISLGNIEHAYHAASGTLLLDEFAHDQDEIELGKAWSAVVNPLLTALHEVIGHASGKLEEGVATPAETLKNHASTIEEGRADLVALYFLMDPALVEMGLLPSLEAAQTGYDGYIRNGLLQQLRRIEPGDDIEESHMRNRAIISRWALARGQADNVIMEVKRDNKTYYDILDYMKLRELFGQLLREVQRIKSQGDYQAARALVKDYGVKVDRLIHDEVLARAGKLNIAPYGGFINPVMRPERDAAGNITDIKLDYMDSFSVQMLYYSKHYSHLAD